MPSESHIKSTLCGPEAGTTIELPPKASFSNRTLVLLAFATIAILTNRVYVTNIHTDSLNVIPAVAALIIAYILVRSRYRSGAQSTMSSRWTRAVLVVIMLLMAGEFGLRCLSYQRAVRYEQLADLLFTPVPDQDYVEKISLSRSHINHLGLRGDDVELSGDKKVILCLGDSVTYGYGVDDRHTYPAELQSALDRKFPGQFLVLNAGVDAYPVSLMREKFLALWAKGVHPDLVVVGYSFNEGGLGHMVQTDRELRARFGTALRLKNELRGIALYNLVVENWGRTFYDRMKRYMISGANSRAKTDADVRAWYEDSLRQLTADLNTHQVTPVFLLFAGLNSRTKRYDTTAPFQLQFQEFAVRSQIPLVASEAVFTAAQSGKQELKPFFLDQCHMSDRGTKAIGEAMADYISNIPGQATPNGMNSDAAIH